MKDRLHPRQGFTLIELSIVLVIIGLIVGGILVGRDMIRQAELRSVVTDIERFKTAINTFRVKYNCLPGDCPNATAFFGINSNGCPTEGGATGTCDGDGNGKISSAVTGVHEWFTAWQQLAEAGLIAGTYPGVGIGNGYETVTGVTVPASRIGGVGYLIGDFNTTGNFNPGYQLPGSDIKTRIVAALPTHNIMNYTPFASAKELMAMEAKLDDGNPVTGYLTAFPFAYSYTNTYLGGNCFTWGASTSDPAIHYNSSDQTFCIIVFDLGI